MMIESETARWLLTAVFVAAALGTVWRWRQPAGQARRADQPAAAFCVVMCAALIAMTWWLEPAAVTWLQVAGFGCAALWFGLASWGRSGQFRQPRLVGMHHALMGGAMIWMLVALSGVAGIRPPGTGQDAMAGMTTMSSAGPSIPVLAVSGLVAACCAAAALPWAARAVGPGVRVADTAAAGQAAMSAGMAAMLIVML